MITNRKSQLVENVGDVSDAIEHEVSIENRNFKVKFAKRFTGLPTQTLQVIATKAQGRNIELLEQGILSLISAFQAFPEPIIATNTDGIIVFANAAAARMTRWRRKEMLGRHISFLCAEPTQLTDIVPQILKKGYWQGDVLSKRKGGEAFISHLTSTLIKQRGGKPFGIMLIARDITGQKETEESIKKLLNKLSTLNEIAAMVSRSLNLNHVLDIPKGKLTRRESQVLRLLARGRSNKEIAAALVISEKTVKTHVSNILQKLHLSDRIQAAQYAVRQKIVAEERNNSRP